MNMNLGVSIFFSEDDLRVSMMWLLVLLCIFHMRVCIRHTLPKCIFVSDFAEKLLVLIVTLLQRKSSIFADCVLGSVCTSILVNERIHCHNSASNTCSSFVIFGYVT
jgi:hypothetical protein